MTGTTTELLSWLAKEVGVIESPPHSNHVRLRNGRDLWVDYFGYQPATSQAAWCALFQSAADIENGTPMPEIQARGFHGFVGVDAGREWFRQRGLLVLAPKPGYLAFFHEHVGRVRSVTGPTTFTTIEGNEGDGVRVVSRRLSQIVGGFGVREYDVAPPSPTPPPPSEEDDMVIAIPAPGPDSPVDEKKRPYEKRTLGLVPGKPGAVNAVSEVYPTAGANVRMAIGSTRTPPFPIKDEIWIPGQRVGWRIGAGSKAPQAEVAACVNYGPGDVTIWTEYD